MRTNQDALPRREQNKRDKRERIIRATRDLLAERGYESMTIRSIAARAEVAVGTVFRYAATKSELLLMVLSIEHQEALEAGIIAAAAHTDPGRAAFALLAPVLAWGIRGGDTTLAYQREVLFGEATERYRPDSLELGLRTESALAAVLADADVPRAELRARVLFNSLQLEVSRALLHGTGTNAVFAIARTELDLVLGTDAGAAQAMKKPEMKQPDRKEDSNV